MVPGTFVISRGHWDSCGDAWRSCGHPETAVVTWAAVVTLGHLVIGAVVVTPKQLWSLLGSCGQSSSLSASSPEATCLPEAFILRVMTWAQLSTGVTA